MRPGTPNFVPGRLRQAREGRSLGTSALADLVDVTPASISQYERGKQKPGPEKLQRLAEVLNVPVEFFTRPLPPERQGSATFYRCMASATVTARARGERRLEWFQELLAYTREFLQLPAVRYPSCPYGTEPPDLSGNEIEEQAARVRDYWGLGRGPISDVTLLLENNGTIVTRGLLAATTLDAFSRWMTDEGVPYIFLGADKISAGRNRFNVAHELGHLMLHRHVPQGTLGRRDQHNLMEAQAHRFAGAFLLPAESFAEELHLPTLDALLALKPRWNVSVGMMIQRMLDLEFITPDQHKRLRIAYSKRGWNKREPLDNETAPEEPRLVRRSIDLLVSRGVQTRAQIRSRLPFGARTVEELACLPVGFLNDEQPEVQVLTLRPRAEPEGAPPPVPGGDLGRVIEFPLDRRRSS